MSKYLARVRALFETWAACLRSLMMAASTVLSIAADVFVILVLAPIPDNHDEQRAQEGKGLGPVRDPHASSSATCPRSEDSPRNGRQAA